MKARIIIAMMLTGALCALIGARAVAPCVDTAEQQEPSTVVIHAPAPDPVVIVRYVRETNDDHATELAELERWRSGYYKDIPLTTEQQDALHEACDVNGIDYNLALAVIFVETNFQNITGDNGNAFGFMQIQKRFHTDRMERLGVSDLMDAESNFRVGCDILAELIGKYGVTGGLTAYNTGHSGTSAYANKVITQFQYFNSWEERT